MAVVRLDKLIIMQRLSRLLEGTYTFTYRDIDNVDKVYQFDTTGRVYRGRKTVSSSEAKHAISILEAPRALVGSPAGMENQASLESWTLNIQGWPPEDRLKTSDNAYLMAAAVRERLAQVVERGRDDGMSEPVYGDEYMFGGSATNVLFGATIVAPPTEGLSEVAFWYMPVVISLVQRTVSR